MSVKFSSLEKYFDILELLFNTLPYVFWKDKEGKYQGSNMNQALNLGASSPTEFIGKTIYEILQDQESAKSIDAVDQEIMRKDKLLILEESIVTPNGERCYLSQKSPIHDENGRVIGLLGFAVDITEFKQQEEAIKKDRDRLLHVAAQVAHDIRSPAASILMLAKSCHELPENERVALREAAISIQDIANNLLNQYKSKNNEADENKQKPEDILLSALVLQVLAEKKLEYSDLPVKIHYEFSQQASFSFIKVELSALRRALSNIINNAVESFDGKEGIININIDTDIHTKCIKIVVEDNGKGMLLDLLEKIRANISITHGKEFGSGFGLQQVREIIDRNYGKFLIESTPEKGTKITLVFQKQRSPEWIATEIRVNADDIIIILDDDFSIHGAWDVRFEPILKSTPSLKIKHFTNGADALAFMNGMDHHRKEKIFLLTDYELLKQRLDGLDIISQGKIKRSILVTSHYGNQLVRDQASKTQTKILPKQLAPEISIELQGTISLDKKTDVIEKVDVIIVDDDENYVNTLILFAFSDKKIAKYHDPFLFLNEISKYPTDTKICLDNNFKNSNLKGIDIAQKLNARGYTRLYLLSGEILDKDEIPGYLSIISKFDIENISKL
jgi:PAS domain S-box-containing protein